MQKGGISEGPKKKKKKKGSSIGKEQINSLLKIIKSSIISLKNIVMNMSICVLKEKSNKWIFLMYDQLI